MHSEFVNSSCSSPCQQHPMLYFPAVLMLKPNTRSGSKSNDSAAPASSTRPPSTKAVVPPRPKPHPSSKASSKVSVRRKRTEEDVVDGGDGEDDHAALTAKIALLERQLKSNANVKAKAAQERLETERQGNSHILVDILALLAYYTVILASRKRTQDMLDAESNAEEDAEDLDAPLLLMKKARQSAASGKLVLALLDLNGSKCK
jgi:hypothetical protein